MDKDNKTKIGVKRFNKSKKWKGKSGNLYTVFDCYDSGDNGEKQQNQGFSLFSKKKYFFAVVLVGALFSFYYAYLSVSSMFSPDKEDTNTTKSIKTKTIKSASRVIALDDNSSKSDFAYSNRFELLATHKDKNSIVSNFVIIYCLYDVKRKLYIFDNRILTQKNFDALNELFLFEILETQIISENVYKYEYLVNSEIANILISKSIKKDKKQKSSFMK